ncbi:hypothetical protein AAVH_09556 [Aphelenchoides avenae]|nr:hypothetical protein AAVH_09556 [Aphelenchus avenae]
MPKRARYALSLPAFVFEQGVIDHEAIELIRQAKRQKETRLERKENEIKKKYDAEMTLLRKEYRAMGNEFE